jgi:hypothetical protein
MPYECWLLQAAGNCCQVAQFHSLDELLAFMRRVLTEVEAQPGAA